MEEAFAGGKDDSVRVTVARKKGDRWEIWQPVSLNVAADPVDPYLVYRLIEPGYALWNKWEFTNVEWSLLMKRLFMRTR